MRPPQVITIDFETEAIQDRPDYPPKPVGVAIKWPEHTGTHYWAWGHPTGNNCDLQFGKDRLTDVWMSRKPVLCHNAKFDLQITTEALGFSMPPWQRVHDTMFLAFLADPHAPKLGLKELCADLLEWPAEEKDELHDWIWQHRVELETAYGGKVKKSALGAWISKAPGDLVGRYAIGDVERTAALFEHLWPLIQEHGMGAAYDRERRLMPILMENECVGMRVDLPGLEEDIGGYANRLVYVETWLRSALKMDLNFDADRDVAKALLDNDIVPRENWRLTKTGQMSVKKDVLTPDLFTGSGGAQIASALGYRNRLKTCLEMFMKPWHAQASQRNGYISTNWNQTRGTGGGTRTGRPSTSNPNFLNLSKSWDDKNDGYLHPEFLSVTPLPLVRRYILPDEGGVFLHRDFKQQEMRIFAHASQGGLFDAYAADPNTNAHKFVGDEITTITGQSLTDGQVKILNFQALYGGGIPAAQAKLRCSVAEAKQFKSFHDSALPERKLMNGVIKRIVQRGEPIRTWGGRVYYVEPDKEGRSQDYKLINYYCQGSAADITKEALCQWHEGGSGKARFLVTVYDEINISSPIEEEAAEMAWLKAVMQQGWLDIAMLSDGKRGPSWGELEKCE